MIKTLYNHMKNSDRGATLVEFAIAVPVFLLLVFGIINFGWIFHGYITLTGAAREGARLAIVGEDVATVEYAIKNHAKIFKEDDLSIPTLLIASPRGETKIEVIGKLNLLVNIFPFPNSVELKASATMRQEQ